MMTLFRMATEIRIVNHWPRILPAILLTLLSQARADTLPADLVAARAAASAYRAAASQQELAAWQPTEVLPTAGAAGAAHWAMDGGWLANSDEGLRVGAKDGPAFVRFKDKTFSGPVGLLYHAQAPRGFPASDLSCLLESTSVKVQLVFGGYANTATHINVIDEAELHPLKNPQAPLIKPETWQTVVLLMYEDHTSAFVDGQPVVAALLPHPVTSKTAFRVALYVASTEGLFKDVTILRPKKVDATLPAPDPKMQPAADAAARYLGDGSYEVREAAADVLWKLRPASVAALRHLAQSTDLETRNRATQLLDRMKVEGALLDQMGPPP